MITAKSKTGSDIQFKNLILLDEEHLTMKEGPSAHHILFFVGYDL